MAKRNVTIIAASSNTGFQCLQDLLVYRGDLKLKIKAAFRSESRAEEFIERLKEEDRIKVDVVVGVDALRADSLAQCFAGSEIAVVVTPHDPAAGTFARDSEMCLNLVEAAVSSGTVKHIIYVSGWVSNLPDQLKAFAGRFLPTEERLSQLPPRISFTSLRSGFFHQNFAMMMGTMAKYGKIAWPDVKIPSVDPRDMGSVAAAICTSPTYAASHGGKYYQICGPEVLTTKDIVAAITQGLGKQAGSIAYEEVPLNDFLDRIPFPPVREIFAALEGNPDLLPFAKDTELVTGQPARPLHVWVEENQALFLPDTPAS